MAPVRIKYYGIIPMTKRAYLIGLVAAGFFVLLILCGFAIFGVMPALDTMWSSEHHFPHPGIGVWLYNRLYWVLVIGLVIQALDVWITLRVFAKKEAEQRGLGQSTDIREGQPPVS